MSNYFFKGGRADPDRRARKERAKRFYEFIATNPDLTYKDYWDADHRPYEKQWPEYRAAVRRVKEMTRRGCGVA